MYVQITTKDAMRHVYIGSDQEEEDEEDVVDAGDDAGAGCCEVEEFAIELLSIESSESCFSFCKRRMSALRPSRMMVAFS